MVTRRTVLKTSSGLLPVSLAGCLDGSVDGTDTGVTRVVSTFFTFYDFARHVAGDAAQVDSLVPLGEQGHGWEPSADVQRQANNADVFVYVGPGVQRWADNVVTNLRSDNPDVVIVNASDGIDLLPAAETEQRSRETDPHFWLDSTLAKHAVTNIRDGIQTADEANEIAYRDNTEAYLDRLDDVDESFRDGLTPRRTNIAVVAGHNAYRYLANRYEFEIFSPIGVTPDAAPSPRAIQQVQEIMDEHDLEYILTPALESDRLARELAQETDADILTISPVAGQTDEWMDKDWGYLEQMLNVNLVSLKTALEAQ